METKTPISKKRFENIVVIYNDDVKVLDFIADLKDNEPLHGLDKFIRFGNHENACLLYCCPLDAMVVLILYKAPFGLNDECNTLMVYAHNDLISMITYFKGCLANERNQICTNAYVDILQLLYHEWTNQKDIASRLTTGKV
jgi:hypothetical protein